MNDPTFQRIAESLKVPIQTQPNVDRTVGELVDYVRDNCVQFRAEDRPRVIEELVKQLWQLQTEYEEQVPGDEHASLTAFERNR